MYEYNAHVMNIVDGDTFDVLIDLGFNVSFNARLRVLDIDTPEKFGEEKEYGLIMKDYAEKLLLNQDIVIATTKDKNTDSFGRYLCSVVLSDGRNLKEIYNALGVNKKLDNYSQENVRRLNE